MPTVDGGGPPERFGLPLGPNPSVSGDLRTPLGAEILNLTVGGDTDRPPWFGGKPTERPTRLAVGDHASRREGGRGGLLPVHALEHLGEHDLLGLAGAARALTLGGRGVREHVVG